MKKILGYSLLSLPFIGLFVLSLNVVGLAHTLGIFSAVVTTITLIAVAIDLITEE